MNWSSLIERFTSRKFLLAVIGALVIFGVPLTGEQIAAITAIIIAFTAGQSAVDYAGAK